MTLKIYHSKRDFKKTSEPKGENKISYSKRLFVIQKHAASHLHYDLRLELNGVLLSWAVPKGPSLDPSIKRLAVHVEDHPIAYAAFEGTIPQGQYGGGAVMLWDTGEWECLEKDPVVAYKKGGLKFILKGHKLQGEWRLIQIKNDPKNWLLMKIKDKFTSSIRDITHESLSVKTNRSLDQIAHKIKNKVQKEIMPEKILPELCTLVNTPPKGKEWLHEIKLDGYRLIVYIHKNKIRLITRGNQDWTKKFPNIVKSLKLLKLGNAIFDSEIVVLDDKYKSSFQLLQNAIKNKENNFVLYVFDLIYFKNKNISHLPLIRRKEILKSILDKSDGKIIRYNDHLIGDGEKILRKACLMTLEGIVSKKINSSYEQKRSNNWLKIKCIKRQEFVVGGFTLPKNSRKYFGSLLLGVYNAEKEFIYCGHVGTGFNNDSLKDMHLVLNKYISQENPFNKRVPEMKNVTWLKPKIVIEVEFTEWTQEGLLRHPSFKGIRKDKSHLKIIREKEKTIKSSLDLRFLTHPDKVLYAKKNITKKDVALYYDQIKSWILPYIINRPLSVVRCPAGIDDHTKKCFFQKHVTASMPSSIYGKTIKEKKEEGKKLIYIKDVKGLLSLVQLGVLEIHPWGSTITKYAKPDMLIFDLDPAPDIKWKEVVKAAFLIREELEKLKLTSFVKSTGGKGLHVVVPIQPEYTWDEIKSFTHLFVDYLVMKEPKKYIAEMNKIKRSQKIFIDYLRNQRGATSIAPYSTRANVDATIATPLFWDELLKTRKEVTFTIKTVQKRLGALKEDPWKDFFKVKQSLDLKKYK